MKLISIVILSIFLAQGCETGQMKDTEIEYTANTRGFYERIVIKDQKVTVSQDRNALDKPAAVAISDEDWQQLVDAFKEINLEQLPNFKAPTEKRFYDGAAIAKLKITHEKIVYESTDFDHGDPPVEVARLVNKIVSYSKRPQ